MLLIGLRPDNRLHPVRHQPTTHPAERQTSMRESMAATRQAKVRSAAHGHTIPSRRTRSSDRIAAEDGLAVAVAAIEQATTLTGSAGST
jgi:hypothetical protein